MSYHVHSNGTDNTRNMSSCMTHTYVRAYIYISPYIYTYYIYISPYIYPYIYTYYIYMHIYIHNTYVHMYIHTYTLYIYIHIHIHNIYIHKTGPADRLLEDSFPQNMCQGSMLIFGMASIESIVKKYSN